ncbi:MAG: glycosyltransferase [Pseudomonadota bacterium]
MYGVARGGSERAALRIVKAWRRLGHEVEMVGEQDGGRTRPLGLAADLVRRAARNRPDILFAPGQTYAIPFGIAARRIGVPLVSKISNLPARPRANGPDAVWLRWQAQWTAAFVAPDAAAAVLLHEIMGVPKATIATIANPAADADRLQKLHAACPAPPSGGPLRLLAAGRLVPQKNFSMLISAFASVAQRHDTLTILGEGPMRARLERRAAACGCNIRLPGHIDDPAAQFAAANAFALSSNTEGLPAVLIEALATGLPIATTRATPGLADLIDAETGILVAKNDRVAMSTAIEDLRSFQPNRETAFETALRFTADAAAPDYISLFSTLAFKQKSRD